MRVADYVVKKLEEFGVEDAFLITGGGAMHLNDAFRNSKKIKVFTPHHEQAVAMAAEGYSRASGKIGVSVVTSGPGGTNTITGVYGQYTDSVPAIYISGQVKWETHKSAYPELALRQLGDQELDTVSIVKSITKFSTVLTDPNDVDKVLTKALFEATSGRPGPVWVDIPLNVQGAKIDLQKLPMAKENDQSTFEFDDVELKAKELLEEIKKAKRPVLVAGHGVRISGKTSEFNRLVKKLGVPVVTTFNGTDNIDSDSPYYAGRIGTLGNRSGNFTIQNSDLYVSLGSRNNIRQVSYFWQAYAREARIALVDIDKAELSKPTLKADLAIHADVGSVIEAMLKLLGDTDLVNENEEWNQWCQKRKEKYDSVLPEYYNDEKGIHPYAFMRELTKSAPEDACFVAANGSACVSLFQSSHVKLGQRHIWNSGCATMGYELPASIGAAVATKKNVICVAGDGSIMMNLQELVSIANSGLPIKVVVLENNGYQSIRQTQRNFFGLPYIGCGPESGVGFPEFAKLGEALGIPSIKVESMEDAKKHFKAIFEEQGPMLIAVKLDRDYIFAPKLSSKKLEDGRMVSQPLENMFPFLPEDEFKENMIIDTLPEG